MKRVLILALLFASVSLGVLGALLASPYYFYHKTVSENYRSKWYFVENYNEKLIAPDGEIKLEDPGLGNERLWRGFHLKDVLVPLPVRNPLYYAAPLLSYDRQTQKTRIGVEIYGTGGREISKIYFLDNALMGARIRSQELFKLPLVKNIVLSRSSDQIWKDLFRKDLSEWNIPFSEMAYNLYLLHLRSKLLPPGFLSYGHLGASTGVVRLASKNKDYFSELVMTRQRGVVYSYLVVTEKNNGESKLLRYKFLKDIGFRPGSEALAGILYKEFKALPYSRKVDHEGMLYLFSAWSHRPEDKEFLKEMIFYLERGEGNQKQLGPLYEYASARYGKTFAKRAVKGLEIDSEMELKRNVELEDAARLKALRGRKAPAGQKETGVKGRFRQRVREAKQSKRGERGRMILD